ncbi:unnamed protein product [Brassicogethes aeneus]|uniref:Tubulin delta chain n=1 Tax=Brassicogethes aeneus TaxID=1431903 RepID=A0A9P0AS33_BRAAE|nr:unnamed protein product [Brassicogethes aeneus]
MAKRYRANIMRAISGTTGGKPNRRSTAYAERRPTVCRVFGAYWALALLRLTSACGNQIGNCLYNTIYDDIKSKDQTGPYYKKAVNKWFNVTRNEKWEPLSVLVDTELKAVNSTNKLPFKFKNVAAKSLGGSANNWAYGYTNTNQTLKTEIMDTIRSQVEKCDYLTSILNIFSSSGGTGSGLGSFIIECIRNEYPSKNITNAIVLPYMRGEIVTQSYNSVLSLSHLYSLADNTILFQNERMHYNCNYSLDIKEVTFENINTLISHQLASVFQPVNNLNTCDILNHLSAHPKYRYLQIRTEPNFHKDSIKFESERLWKPLVNSLSKQSRFEYTQQEQNKVPLKVKNISSVLISRGSEKLCDKDLVPLKDKNLYVSWLQPTDSFNNYHDINNFLSLSKSLTNVVNNNNIFVPLNCIVEDAWNLFTNNAYLHHYKKFVSDWSEADKRRLLLALKTHGSYNLDLIHKEIPEKSLPEIQNIINKYMTLGKARQNEYSNPSPLKQWEKLIKQINLRHRYSILDVLPRVLKYIALFEEVTQHEENDINISDCYKVLSDISYGLASKEMDPKTNHFFYECLRRLSVNLKNQDLELYKEYINSLTDFEDLGGNHELEKKKTIINPLNIPEQLLEATNQDKSNFVVVQESNL